MSASGMSAGPCTPAEVNRRDSIGRTVLHLLASSSDRACGEYIALLLTHPSLNVNVQDAESGWTALHRALYVGNLRTAVALLQRAQTDVHIRDWEGLTAFELYNSTVDGTNPVAAEAVQGSELFVWGGNRNYSLGLGHSNDTVYPERVKLPRRTNSTDIPGARFNRIRVRDTAMSKWHTVVVTTEEENNVYMCGIGSQGRLGRMPQAQPILTPLNDFSEIAASAALGQDHTVLVTTSGAVYTFGANRMAQLGYTIEEGLGTVASSSGTKRSSLGTAPLYGISIGANGAELDIQVTPRRVLGVLKRDVVLGAAASRLHTAVFTADALYTWGTNTGQLGYDSASAPVQVQPRKVTAINQRVQQVAATEFATACLLVSGDVVVCHGNTHFRIAFPVPRTTPDQAIFRPRHSQSKPTIIKLTCSGTLFAALSEAGALFTFTMEHPAGLRGSVSTKVVPPRPQLVWSVRRKFSAVRDVDVGPESALILCTASGHVYVRTPRPDNAISKTQTTRAAKFQKVPFLQRIVRVKMNEAGSFAALEAPPHLLPLSIIGSGLQRELLLMLPHVSYALLADRTPPPPARDGNASDSSEDEDETTLRRSAHAAESLMRQAVDWRERLRAPMKALPDACIESGCDAVLMVDHGNYCLPLHATLLLLRLPHLSVKATTLDTDGSALYQDNRLVLACPSLSLVSAYFLLHYLYTDDLPPVWTANMQMLLSSAERKLDVSLADVQRDLQSIAQILQLDALLGAVQAHIARPPVPTLPPVTEALFNYLVHHTPGSCTGSWPPTDAVLHLADREVRCHTLFLRRSPMMQGLLVWHREQGNTGTTHVDMPHFSWPVVQIGLRYLYTDNDLAVFAGADEDKSADAFIDLVLDVLQFADELLLARLQSLCSILLRERIKATNVAALLSDAIRYNAPSFTEVCLDYCTRNLETLLESGLLNDLPSRGYQVLGEYIQQRQDRHLSRTLASDRIVALWYKHKEYMESLDLPKPSLNMVNLHVPKWTKPRIERSVTRSSSPGPSAPGGEDTSLQFAMDDLQEALPTWQTVGARSTPSRRTPTRTEPSPRLDAQAQAPASASQGSASLSRPMLANTPTFVPRVPRPWEPEPPRPDVVSTSPSMGISQETQDIYRRLPLASRVSQKERKKQRTFQPEPTLDTSPGPAWGHAHPSPSPVTPSIPRVSTVPSPQAAASSPPALTFAQIQQQQQAVEVAQVVQQTPSNFAQIQQEESRALERQRKEQQEAESFERWFEAESRRVQGEQTRIASSSRNENHSRRGRRGGGPKRGGRGKSAPSAARIDDE